MTDQVEQAFLKELGRALQHLYDPVELRRSPLLARFGLERRPNPALALQETLIAAIQALKPAAGVPAQANAWRYYRILTYRYVEQSPQKQVADDLALSIRQLRRLENEALTLLADSIAQRHGLQAASLQRAPAPQAETAADSTSASVGLDDRSRELDWLRRSLSSETAAVAELMAGVLQTAEPVLRAMDVAVRFHPPAETLTVICQVTTLRQALLSLLTAAGSVAAGGEVVVDIVAGARQAEIRVRSVGGASTALKDDGWQESIEIARQLAGLSGGTLRVQADGEAPFTAFLSLDLTEQAAVLAIDDNADTLQLLARYLVGSRYRLIGVQDPEQGLNLATKAPPCAIILDVMLPGIDGWELLGKLHAHPATASVPVIVATILPQEQLALALGAASFLRKPFSRKTLLATLAAVAPGRPTAPALGLHRCDTRPI